jgi:DHA2 family multidrug resistance protein
LGKLIQRDRKGYDWCWVLDFLPMMHNNTPNTGEDDMYWALILRGIGLGLLFVPITTYQLYFIWEKILVKELHLQV